MNILSVYNLSPLTWETILLNNYNKQIDSFVNLMAGKRTRDLHFHFVKKTLTCENLILNLSNLTLKNSKANNFKCSNEISPKIKYLAKCIANLLKTKQKKHIKRNKSL